MYNLKRGLDKAPSTFECPECGSKIARFSYTKLTCANCDYVMLTHKSNKFGAKRQTLDGKSYDSGFEMETAASLMVRKLAKDIKDFETQYKVECWAYKEDGTKAFLVKHKVDFRIHHNDGSYELLEAKGVETDDYKWRRKFLENIWLPAHPDHTYTVVKQEKHNRRKKR